MRFNLISNIANGVGLQQDYELLRRELEKRGHTVQGVQFNAKPFLITPADVNIFLEVVVPTAFSAAKQQWVVPHPEWWFEGWGDYQWDLVLAKTHDCYNIFAPKFGPRCRYIGWLARDLYNPDIPRERRYLQVAGKSHFKNTTAVREGCQIAGVPLTLVAEPTRVTNTHLAFMMNSHFCQIMPSAYEGYGHVLHEALGAGQIVITTDAPPMNELTPTVLVRSEGTRKHHAGLLHSVSARDVARAIHVVMKMSPSEAQQWSDRARAQFLQDEQDFQYALYELLK